MNGLPYYKAYPRDFIEGTIGMPFELKAAYRLVLDLIYMQGGGLPDDPSYIAALLGCSKRAWTSYRAKLLDLGKIRLEDGLLRNYRADIELQTLAKLSRTQAEKRLGKSKNNALPEPQLNHTESEPEPDKKDDVDDARAGDPAGSGDGGRAEVIPLRVVSSQPEPEPDDATLFDLVLDAAGIREVRGYWMPPAAIIEVGRWRPRFNLTAAQIVEAIRASRKAHQEPVRGPRGLERMLESYAAALHRPEPERPQRAPNEDQGAPAPQGQTRLNRLMKQALADINASEAKKGGAQ